jgi:Fe-Mn family superoxide dismutase
MAFERPALPYPKDALEPHMSARTLEFHHGKHHQAYYTALNAALVGHALEGKSLEDIVRESANNDATVTIFNNAAQAWNHNQFWEMMKPNGGGEPTGPLADAIAKSFGSFANFRDAFKTAGVGQFGSGWAWLVLEDGTLKVKKTPNGVNPLVVGGATLLGCDVWEHAYYLDYQNRRADYIVTFIDHLVNWDDVSRRFAAAGG